MGYKNATRKQKELGEKGEESFAKFVESKGLLYRRYNEKKNQVYLGDFKVWAAGKKVYTNYEVKTRDKRMDDILIEIWNDKTKGIKGWLGHLKSTTRVFYQFMEDGSAYVFKIQDMRDFLKMPGTYWKQMRPRGKKDRNTIFVCVPIKTLIGAGVCRKVK